jgi:hypothetical protein
MPTRLFIAVLSTLIICFDLEAQIAPPSNAGMQGAGNAQDTIGVVKVDPRIERARRELEQWREEILGLHSPNKAALYSAILPGLGQAYNKKYWKIPILTGAAVVTGYYINFNQKRYNLFRRAYFAEIDDDPETINPLPRFSPEGLQRNVEYFRRNRDLLFITSGLIYLLQIADAHADAHLFNFDVSEDIAFKFEPSLQALPNGVVAAGISFTIILGK